MEIKIKGLSIVVSVKMPKRMEEQCPNARDYVAKVRATVFHGSIELNASFYATNFLTDYQILEKLNSWLKDELYAKFEDDADRQATIVRIVRTADYPLTLS